MERWSPLSLLPQRTLSLQLLQALPVFGASLIFFTQTPIFLFRFLADAYTLLGTLMAPWNGPGKSHTAACTGFLVSGNFHKY